MPSHLPAGAARYLTTNTSCVSSNSTGTAVAAAATAAMLLAVASTAGAPAFTEGEETLEQQREADWDLFMYKSIVPGEDDDDDDDDDDEDDDDEEEEEEESEDGPADETEDGGADADDEQQNATLGQDEAEVGQEGGEQPSSTDSSKDESSSGPADDAEDVEQEGGNGADPYDNLPEEDEPTGCTICLINRQGPCRPFWRKFERCMKDHGDSTVGGGDGDGDSEGKGESSDGDEKSNEDGGNNSLAEMCDKYMLPWLNCIQSYRNTYTLITNNFYQSEYVDALEKAVPEADRSALSEETWSVENNLDLSLWNDYVAEEKEKLKKDAESMSDEEVEEAINLARAYLQEKEEGETGEVEAGDATSEEKSESGDGSASDLPSDPQLIPATTKIVLRDPVSGHPIDMAYVRDQNGRVLGFEQFTNEKKMMRGEPVEGEEGEPKEAPLVANCGFHLQPGVTTSFKVYTLYREDVPCPEEIVVGEGKEGEKEEEGPKAEEKLYYTQAIPLVEGLDQ